VSVLVVYHSTTGNTEKMGQGVADGVKGVSGATVVVKRVGEVAANDLLSSNAVIVGSAVYFGNMAGEVKTFFDNWSLKFDFFRKRKMRNKVGAAFATGASFSNGKEITILGIFAATFINHMVVVSGGGGFGATATTGPDSPGIDDKEPAEARELGKRVAEVTAVSNVGRANNISTLLIRPRHPAVAAAAGGSSPRMNRRAFITGVAAVLAAPRDVEGQPSPKSTVIGAVSGRLPKNDPCVDSLRKSFVELGYPQHDRESGLVEFRRAQRSPARYAPLPLC
jgi:NAD(P)H dehydrogenase (quinone)